MSDAPVKSVETEPVIKEVRPEPMKSPVRTEVKPEPVTEPVQKEATPEPTTKVAPAPEVINVDEQVPETITIESQPSVQEIKSLSQPEPVKQEPAKQKSP